MSIARVRTVGRAAPAVGCLTAVSLLAAACGAATDGATSTRTATPAVAATPAGPASWAAWIEKQGFGGQSGPNEVRRNARFIAEHGGAETLFDLDQDIANVSKIIDWLDTHPATECWADYHASVSLHLAAVRDAWVSARPEVEGGHLVPADVVALASTHADAANDLPTPSDCP